MAPFRKWPARLAPPVLAADTQAMMFWQSRHNLRSAPALTDLRALARNLGASACSPKHVPSSPA